MRALLLVVLTLLLVGEAESFRWRWGSRDEEGGRRGRKGRVGRERDEDSWWNRLLSNMNGGRWSGQHSFGFGGPDSPFNFGLGWSFGRQQDWWEGPNVCYSETVDNGTASEVSVITHHFRAAVEICEESDTAYRCKSTLQSPDGQTSKVEMYECCHGFSRQPEEFGCPEELKLVNLEETARGLGLNDLLVAVSSTGLESNFAQGNLTIFAPVDGAFLLPSGPGITLQGDQAEVGAVKVSEAALNQLEGDLKDVLLGHVLPDPRKASSFSDEDVLATASSTGSTIRINFYSSPDKLTTANCVRVMSTDNMATNGIIHTVEKVLPIVTETLMDKIQADDNFSYLKTALAQANLVSTLKASGQWTLFAPTNAAFEALDSKFRDRLMNGNTECLQKVLKEHLLPNVICSAVIKGRAKSRNALNNYLNLTRTDDGKVFVGDAQVVRADYMATNGVMHIIDAVLIPDDALDLVTMAKKAELTELVRLVQAAGLTSTLQNTDNVTVFAPSNDAIKALPEDVVKTLTSDPAKLERVLTYHMVPEELTRRELFDERTLDTLNTARKLRVKEYFSSPFRHDSSLMVQCANVIKANLPACNGIVHVIDKVIMPPVGNLVDVLAADSRYSTLVRLFKIAGLADGLQEDGPYTIFAPTNEAFTKLGKETLKELEGNREQLAEVLKLHVIQGYLCCGGIFKTSWWHQQRASSLGGHYLFLERSRYGRPYVNNAAIDGCDNTATNGVVHAITDVLMFQRNPFMF